MLGAPEVVDDIVIGRMLVGHAGALLDVPRCQLLSAAGATDVGPNRAPRDGAASGCKPACRPDLVTEDAADDGPSTAPGT